MITLVHSSDLHIDNSYTARRYDGDGTAGLRRVLNASSELGADVTLLAGDLFEHNRLPVPLLEQAVGIMADYGDPIVVLPGNHDPLTDNSVYKRGNFSEVSNVAVLGLTHQTSIVFEDLDLEIWGNAHYDYVDMQPLNEPVARNRRWHIAMAHGHYHNDTDKNASWRASWLFGDDEIDALQVDYLALGHWDVRKRVGPPGSEAHYSGSPEYAGTVNVVRLSPDEGVDVSQHPLD